MTKNIGLNRRTFVTATAAGLAAPAVWTSARAQAVVTLKLHHFLPPVSNGHAKMLAPWAKKVEADSQGKIKIEDVVAGMAGVLEVAAVGIPDEKSGEAVKLVVVKKDPSLTADDIRNY